MKKIIFTLIGCFLLAVSNGQTKNFKVFNGMMLKTPSLARYGIRPIHIIYEDSVLTKAKPDASKINKSFNHIKRNLSSSVPICFDIESWDLKNDNTESIRKYNDFIVGFKKNVTRGEYGFFGVIPTTELLLYPRGDSNRWNIINNNLKQLSNNITVAYPICYTRGTDMMQWLAVTKSQIAKIKQLNKNVKIYPFIWPQYYTKGGERDREFLSYSDWMFQLTELYKLADGIVIWMPPFDQNRRTIYWDNNWKWWLATKDFVIKNKIK